MTDAIVFFLQAVAILTFLSAVGALVAWLMSKFGIRIDEDTMDYELTELTAFDDQGEPISYPILLKKLDALASKWEADDPHGDPAACAYQLRETIADD